MGREAGLRPQFLGRTRFDGPARAGRPTGDRILPTTRAAVIGDPLLSGSAVNPGTVDGSLPLEEKLTRAIGVRTQQILARRQTGRGQNRGWLVPRMLALADVVGLSIAFALTEASLGSGGGVAGRLGFGAEVLVFAATLPAWILVAKLYGLYDRDEESAEHSTVDEVVEVFHFATVGVWLVFIGAWLTDYADPQILRLGSFWVVAIVAVTLARVASRAVYHRLDAYVQNTLIVGAGPEGQLVARKIVIQPDAALNLVGFVDEDTQDLPEDLNDIPILGPPDSLEAIVEVLGVERVHLCAHGRFEGTHSRAYPPTACRPREYRSRPTPIRRRRAGRSDALDRGARLVGASILPTTALVASRQADDGQRSLGACARGAGPLLRSYRHSDQT